LEDDAAGRELASGQRVEEPAYGREIPQRAGEVHRDRELEAASLPGPGLAAGLGDDPVRQRRDQAGALREWDELARRDELGAVLPTHERLACDGGAGREVDDRLVVQDQVAALDGAREPGGGRDRAR